jgi:drug/metabolite transporter (DMT)-like permease
VDILIFLLAQIPPMLYASTNLIDKHILGKYFEDDSAVMILVIISALASLGVAPIAYIIDQDIFSLSWRSIAVLVGVSAINTVLLWAYLKALYEDDPTTVIICYQMVPIFTLVSGYFLLSETLSGVQATAMIVILAGTFVAAFKFKKGAANWFRWRTLFYMAIACLCWSLETVVFKKVAVEEAFWPSIFWTNLSQFFIGVLLLACLKPQRKQFIAKFKENGRKIFAWSLANEILYLVGNTLTYLAAMQTKVALVMLVQTYQAIYVFIFGVIGPIFLKSMHREDNSPVSVATKLSAIAITGYGSYLLLVI